MLEVIESRDDQLKEFELVWARLRKDFRVNSEIRGHNVLRNFQGVEELRPYGLSLWARGTWMGIDLWGPSLSVPDKFNSVLAFATYSPRGGTTAALLARTQSRIGLYHDGRVFTRDGRGRPSTIEGTIKISGRPYYHVADLEDPSFFSEIVAFHRSRLNPDLRRATTGSNTGGGSGFSGGTKQGGTRSQATFDALHHPITEELRKKLKPRFGVIPCPVMNPDLLVKEQGGKTLLFEVKPSSRAHDVMLACAQLLIYNRHAKADKMVIVSEPLGTSPMVSSLTEFMAESGIFYMEYRRNKDGKVIFPLLKRIVE